MRWLVRIGLVVGLLFAAALVALALLAPRLIDTPEVRDRIAAAAKDATGRTLRYETLGIGILPPRLEVTAVALEGGPKDAPLRAERVALEVALLPLLARTVLVDSLAVSGAELTLVRTQDGIALPIELPEPEPPREGEEETGAEQGAAGGVSVAVREVEIEKSRVTLVDRSVKPVAEWVVSDLDARAEGRLGTDAPIEFDVAAGLHGAKLSASGEASPGGALDAKLALADFPLERLGPYLPAGLALSGTATLAAEAEGTVERFAGPLAVDLTRADIVQGESFRKPAGERAALTGRLVRDGEAIRLEEGQLALLDAKLAVTADLAPRVRARIDAKRFELSSFSGWLPGLGASGATGGVALEAVEVGVDPLSVKGGVLLDGVGAPVGETRGVLTGRLEGKGDSLSGESLELKVAEQVFRLGLDIVSLAKAPEARLRLASESADAAKLVAGLSGKPGTLEGPLVLGSDLRAPLSDPDALLRALRGRVDLNVSPGRLRGVSLLRATFDALGRSGGIAERLGSRSGEMERFYRDAFETLAGSFQIAGGQARTDDLHLLYRDYRVDLAGALGLLDRSLDFRGRLTLFEDVDQALAGAPRGVKREIPLAAVRGSLDDPKVTITPQVALAFAASVYGTPERREKLERKVDERLGEGAGKQVFDALDSLLGGGKRQPEEQP